MRYGETVVPSQHRRQLTPSRKAPAPVRLEGGEDKVMGFLSMCALISASFHFSFSFLSVSSYVESLVSFPAHLPTDFVLSHIETIILWIFILFSFPSKHVSNGPSHQIILLTREACRRRVSNSCFIVTLSHPGTRCS